MHKIDKLSTVLEKLFGRLHVEMDQVSVLRAPLCARLAPHPENKTPTQKTSKIFLSFRVKLILLITNVRTISFHINYMQRVYLFYKKMLYTRRLYPLYRSRASLLGDEFLLLLLLLLRSTSRLRLAKLYALECFV